MYLLVHYDADRNLTKEILAISAETDCFIWLRSGAVCSGILQDRYTAIQGLIKVFNAIFLSIWDQC